jgi:hypothetical protein
MGVGDSLVTGRSESDPAGGTCGPKFGEFIPEKRRGETSFVNAVIRVRACSTLNDAFYVRLTYHSLPAPIQEVSLPHGQNQRYNYYPALFDILHILSPPALAQPHD